MMSGAGAIAAYALLAITLIVTAILLLPVWRRKRILARPFPQHWRAVLDRNLPFVDRLGDSQQRQLDDMIRLFIADKHFYGCGGLVMNDEIRVTIAAQACLLLLNRRTGVYPRLKHILVYPDAFIAGHEELNPDGTVSAEPHGMLGESWDDGKVILSWDDVEHDLTDFRDGHNVVLHEFSHQLDSESGWTDGVPLLGSGRRQRWTRVLNRVFEELQKVPEDSPDSVLDPYGATSPAEFFAVATETFFEMPAELRGRHPELYRELQDYYRVDPVRWQSSARR